MLAGVAARFRVRYRPCPLRNRNISSLPPLPPKEEWKAIFPMHRLSSRVSIKDPEMADRLAESFLSDEHTGPAGEGKIVIEAFPGPGCLTRSLLKLPTSKIKKLIVLESTPKFLEYLKPLEEADPRVTVLPLDGYTWTTYAEIEARGLLNDVVTKPWEEGKPNLHFVAQMPNSVLGEQLTNQFCRFIPEHAWLFKYGRVPMSLLFSRNSYLRCTSTRGSKEYSKLSVIANAVSEIKEAVPVEDLEPYAEYFHPSRQATTDRKGTKRPPGSPYVAVNISALENPIIQRGLLDKWDYVTRRLFVLRNTPLNRSINSLGPGARNLLHTLSDPNLPAQLQVNGNKAIRDLTMSEWKLIVKAFDEWSFAPSDLQISDALYWGDERKR